MTAGPWKIRLVAPDGSRCVRICQRDEQERKEREAKEKADREAKEEAEAARLATEEAARLEREKPDREKALQWLDAIDHDLIIMVPVFAEKRIADLVESGSLKVLSALHALMAELKNA